MYQNRIHSITNAVSTEHIASALGARKSGSGWMARCPAHDDKTPSLSITESEGRTLVRCHAGCSQEDVINALRDRGLWESTGAGGVLPLQQTRNPATASSLSGITLEQYSRAKHIPVDFLNSLQLSEITYENKPAVRMPYLDSGGETPAARIRRELQKHQGGDFRFAWKTGSNLCLYGLWRLNRDIDHVILVEGESDCHTLWYQEYNALGIPGANNWRENRDAQHLEDFQVIYVVIEPDQGGDAVLNWLESSSIRDRVRLVHVPAGDVSDLYLTDPGQFKLHLDGVLEQAESWSVWHQRQVEESKRDAWATCHEIAASADILHEFENDLRRLDVVGESRMARIIFLALISRFLGRPVSVAVKGPSSGGKSFIVDQTLRFFPPEAFYALTAMSERALAYSTEPLKHRFLVVYEAVGLEGDLTSYLIRSLLSEGRVAYETVEKTKDGMKPRLIVREGPTGLLVTTTSISLHPENETRLLSLTVTDTKDQTAKILKALATDSTKSVEFQHWHALQRWLETSEHRVVIPFAQKLAKLIPPVAVRLRRDFTQILNLIKAHAILHQASRERDARGFIITQYQDYEAVRSLVAPIVSEGIDATVPIETCETVAAVEQLGQNRSAEDGVMVSEVALKLKLDKSTTSRRVRKAIVKGFLRNLETKRGKPSRLVIGELLPEDIEILPSVERLRSCTVPEEDSDSPPSSEDRGDQSAEERIREAI